MFNERDRRCAAVQLMHSNDPSYDNRTLTSTLKMQIRTVQRAQGDENKVSGNGYGLWCGFKWGPHHATSHLRSRLESQHQSVPGYAEESGDPLVQLGGRWQTLGVAARLGAGQQVQRDPGLASGVLRLCTLLSMAPLLPWPEPAGLLRLVIRREHHQHDLPQHQSQPDRRHPPSIRWAPASACGKVLAGRPTPARPCEGFHSRTSIMNSYSSQHSRAIAVKLFLNALSQRSYGASI